MTTFTCPCGEIVKMDWESPRYSLCERCERLWRETPRTREERDEIASNEGDSK